MKRLALAGLLAVPLWAQQPDKGSNADLIAARAATIAETNELS